MYIVTKKRTIITVVIVGLVFILAIIGLANSPFGNEDTACKHVMALGWRVSHKADEVKKTTIPLEFDESYLEYNKLQNQVGFDLTPYRGKVVTRYTFKIIQLNGAETLRANVLMYRGKVVGGDICTVELPGFMMPLEKNREQKGWMFN